MTDLTNDLNQLKVWRDNNARKSRDIVDIWLSNMERHIDSLGKEKYLVLEQVCVAALDCNELAIAESCIERLFADFPNSMRVQKLWSMLLEADEKYDKALEVLKSISAQDDTYGAAKKRRVAILKSLGRNVEAITELTEYLKVHMIDVEAWQELSELYMNEHDYSKAAFCVEELILFSPHNHLLHQRYADIKYTQGGLENLELARAYYSQALVLNSKNMRALYGLYLTATALCSSQKSTAQKKKEAGKLAEYCLAQINERYSNVQLDGLDKCLAALEL